MHDTAEALEQLAPGINGFGQQGRLPLIGTPTLTPETSTSTEIGVYYDNLSGFTANLTVFDNKFEDKIASGQPVATDQVSIRPHHTEYEMSASGMLFANDHNANRSFIFDLTDPLHPKVATSFRDMAGFAMPHSFLRLPNGHVLASFQQKRGGHDMHGDHDMAGMDGKELTGGIVEIDDGGRVVRAVSNADPAHPEDTLLGRIVRKPVGFLDVADQAALVAQGDQIVADDLGIAHTFKILVDPLPIAGHWDVVQLVDEAGSRKCQVSSWELPLDGSRGQWQLEVVGG